MLYLINKCTIYYCSSSNTKVKRVKKKTTKYIYNSEKESIDIQQLCDDDKGSVHGRWRSRSMFYIRENNGEVWVHAECSGADSPEGYECSCAYDVYVEQFLN